MILFIALKWVLYYYPHFIDWAMEAILFSVCGGAGIVWGRVLCNTAVLFEKFVFCFACKRMIKSCDMIVLVVIKKQKQKQQTSTEKPESSKAGFS